MGKSLLVIFSGGINVDPETGQGLVDHKTLSALREFQSRLGGTVYLGSTGPTQVIPSSERQKFVDVDEISHIEIINRQITRENLGIYNPDFVFFPLQDPGCKVLSEFSGKIIMMDDLSPRVRMQVTLAGQEMGQIDQLRVKVGGYRRTAKDLARLRHADGMQVNGYAAYGFYSKFNKNVHRFFDHRVRAEEIAESARYQGSKSSEVLRIAFSGRLLRIKGVQHFYSIINELDRLSVPHSFSIIGDGPEGDGLKRQIGERASFLGFMKFEDEWLDYVRSNVDIMLLPHIQGDSSSTYFESLGAGVPIIGFDNASLTPLEKDSQAALVSPMGDIQHLAMNLKKVAESSDTLSLLRKNSLRYMSDKSFEDIMDARVDHLLKL